MPFANRASLGAPAVTGGAGGLKWLHEFLRLCTDCKFDFVPIHWYDSANNIPWLQEYLRQANDATHSVPGNREI